MNRSVFNRLGAILLLAIMFAFNSAANAEAWWDAKWQSREKISFDTTDKGAAIKDNVTDVPVLIRLHATNFVFEHAKEDGSDIRFMASDDKSPLKFHIESYDSKKKIALIWVRVPQISGAAASDSVWLYYGNSSVQSGQDSLGTYDTAQALVLHMSELDGTPKDSTGYANNSSEFSGKLGLPAIIGGGASFDGSGKMVVKRAPSLKFDKGFTFSSWVKLPQVQSDARLFSWDDGSQSIVVGINGARVYAAVGGKTPAKATATVDLPLQSWHQVAVVADPSSKHLSLYLDGQAAGSATLGAGMPSPASELAFGADISGKNAYVGDMDEIQISSLPRSAAWLEAQLGSQGQDGKLITFSQEEAGKGGGGELDHAIHMMKVISKSVSLDGWMIIGLCSSMLFLAIGVFIFKFMYLQKLNSANADFMESFHSEHEPLQIDADSDEHEDSSLFRVYKAGSSEVKRLLAKTRSDENPDKNLSPASIGIFEASLDRASVYEGQKMTSWLIVMTLSISGGPFWGLLGTVWGVMNTFAGLAEAGEANLSAIAPGIASALACTLFGLVVAIPCLFAYSYLTNRMKKINQDMRLFIGEFTSKVEESYGEEK